MSSYEYTIRPFRQPPTAADLHCLTQEGSSLVSVTLDLPVQATADLPAPATASTPRYLAYLERDSTALALLQSHCLDPQLLPGAQA